MTWYGLSRDPLDWITPEEAYWHACTNTSIDEYWRAKFALDPERRRQLVEGSWDDDGPSLRELAGDTSKDAYDATLTHRVSDVRVIDGEVYGTGTTRDWVDYWKERPNHRPKGLR